MRIVAYTSPDAPLSYRWVAQIFVPAKAGETMLPVYFKGATKEAAVTRAENFWHSEKAKEAAREAALAERREQARLKRLHAPEVR